MFPKNERSSSTQKKLNKKSKGIAVVSLDGNATYIGVATELSIKILERGGVIYIRHAYPFAKSEIIQYSTGIRTRRGFPLNKHINVPVNPSELSCLKFVENPELLIEKLRQVNMEHLRLMKEDIAKLIGTGISEADELAYRRVLRIKERMEKFYPDEYYKFENEMRFRLGIKMLTKKEMLGFDPNKKFKKIRSELVGKASNFFKEEKAVVDKK
jgi:hypothetical protein